MGATYSLPEPGVSSVLCNDIAGNLVVPNPLVCNKPGQICLIGPRFFFCIEHIYICTYIYE